MPDIGATLREARMRARIDLSEIEAQTKIRARYLRALENEEWDLLPGPTFIRSFLRTYATALGLDGKALVEEYRLKNEHPGESELQPLISPRGRRSASRQAAGRSGSGRRESGDGGGPSPSRGYMVTVAVVAILIVFLIVGLLTRSSSKGHQKAGAHHERVGAHARTGATHAGKGSKRSHSGKGSSQPGSTAGKAGSASRSATAPTVPGEATISLEATATVWVCLIGEGEERLIPGIELEAGQTSGPYHAKRFQMTLGNNEVKIQIDGKTMPVPASAEPIGYEITPSTHTTLPPAEQPTCQ